MTAPFLARDYPYLNNVNLEHRLMGFQAGLVPLVQNISHGRLDMFAGHVNQAMVLDGAEWPLLFSGYEQNLGEYEFSTSNRTQDVLVLAVIPKYPLVRGERHIHKNPSLTVVYRGLEDNKIGYFTVDSYTKCSDGFGYENVYLNTHLLSAGQYIPKEAQLTTSPIHKNGLYCMGVNANVAFMTLEDTIEDAMLISRTLAAKMRTTEIHREVIPVFANQHPLNIYGDETEFKLCPDIGECVNDTGVLAGFRPISSESFMSDVQPRALEQPQFLHDEIFYAPPGAEILDYDFHVAKGATTDYLYAQVEKYIYAANRYWREIINIYQQNKHELEPTKEFNTLVTTAIKRLAAAGESVPGLSRKPKTRLLGKNKRFIDFMQIVVTYMTKRDCSLGFKITGRDGCKGVVCRVADDADMPVDDYGIRADLVIDPKSVIARMNTSQWNEQAINRVSEFMRRGLEATYKQDPEGSFSRLIEYYADINPNYAELVRTTKDTSDARAAHVRDAVANGISIHVPAGLNTVNLKLIKYLKDKYNVKVSPVTYVNRDEDGTVTGVFRTKADVCIGSKYVYLLCKIPEPSSSGIARVNQYNTPMKSSAADRLRYPIRQSPIRFGEDEVRIESMDLAVTSEVMRLMSLQGNSQKGVSALAEEILTNPYPTRITRISISTPDLVQSNTVVRVFHHMMATMGVGSTKIGPYPIIGGL